MSWQRAPLFLYAAAGSLLLLCLFVLLLSLRSNDGVSTPVVLESGPLAKTDFPKDFGQLAALVPFAGGVAPIAAQVVSIEHAPEFRDTAWVQAQNAESFTIQVLAVRDEEAVKRFLASVPDRNRYNYFQAVLDGSAWYVVTTGSYATVELARGIAESGSFGTDTKPFPRRLGAYQAPLPVSDAASAATAP